MVVFPDRHVDSVSIVTVEQITLMPLQKYYQTYMQVFCQTLKSELFSFSLDSLQISFFSCKGPDNEKLRKG